MKAILSILLTLVFVSPALADESPELVAVYCFSEDLEAGFKDKYAAYFCKELGKRGGKKKSLALDDSGTVKVNFLGREPINTKGETTYFLGGYAWTPDQTKQGARAVIQVGDFSKGFYSQGVNDAALMNLWEKVESWIRENRATILEKASQK